MTLAPLAAAVVTLYTPYRSVAFAFLVVSITAALYAGVVTGVGALAAVILVVLCYFAANTRDDRRKQALWLTGIGCISFLMALHIIPGFNYTPIVSNMLLSPQATSFRLAIGYDKALAGALLVFFLVQVTRTKDGWRKVIRATLVASVATLLCVIPLGLLLGVFAFDPKLSPYLPLWIFLNLFVTVIAEEAFFRVLLQDNLTAYLSGKVRYAAWWSVLVVAIIFAVAHGGGGFTYAVLVFFAGCGYGMAYKLGGGIEAAVGTHFIVNLVHFVFFTYPMLANP